MKKWILLFSLFSVLTSYGQYNYTYTDPCTLVSRSVYVPAGGGVTVNYFGSINTFQPIDFQNGIFDGWIEQVAQLNSSSPCEEVTTTVVNNISNITVANTLTVITNVISVTNVAQSIATIGGSMGSSMTATAGSVTNSSQSEGSSTNQNSKDDKKSDSNTSSGTNTGSTGTSPTGNQSQGGQTTSNPSGGTPAGSSTGTPQQGGDTSNPNQPTSTGSSASESSVEGASGGGSNLANSLSNAIDGGSADGGSTSGGGGRKSNNTNKNAGSLIASGDIVAIANTDQTQNFRFVGSITHANTRGTRIKGALFNFTSGVNNLNITFYKSWINKSKKLNTVGAQSFMMDFDKNFFSTTTVLESYKVSNKLTGMFGLNFTAGKMGERELFNLSAVGGAHTTFKVNNRINTSLLVLGVYSPFTQFYEGRWWDAGILVVPFSSWDIKITKTFKFNVSFTGVYQAGESFLNYQVLTGGKLNF